MLVPLQLQQTTVDSWVKLLLKLHFNSYIQIISKDIFKTLILGLKNVYHAHWLQQPIPNFSRIF